MIFVVAVWKPVEPRDRSAGSTTAPRASAPSSTRRAGCARRPSSCSPSTSARQREADGRGRGDRRPCPGRGRAHRRAVGARPRTGAGTPPAPRRGAHRPGRGQGARRNPRRRGRCRDRRGARRHRRANSTSSAAASCSTRRSRPCRSGCANLATGHARLARRRPMRLMLFAAPRSRCDAAGVCRFRPAATRCPSSLWCSSRGCRLHVASRAASRAACVAGRAGRFCVAGAAGGRGNDGDRPQLRRRFAERHRQRHLSRKPRASISAGRRIT